MRRVPFIFGLLISASVFTVGCVWASNTTGCRQIVGISPLLKPGAPILLGEVHGTAEAPAFAGEFVCHALNSQLEVVLALEIPATEQPNLDNYLKSNGDTSAKRAFLFPSKFWHREYQDGRSSVAIFQLIDRMRVFHHTGLPVRVIAIDGVGESPKAIGPRSSIMADHIRRAFLTNPRVLVISLTGNIHNMLKKPSHFPHLPVSMASYLTDLNPIALNFSSDGGEAWNCSATCGVSGSRSSNRNSAKWRLSITDPTGEAIYSGEYWIGETTASIPAEYAFDKYAQVR